MTGTFTLGLDFGTESVRAVIARVSDGRLVGEASSLYAHGVIEQHLPGDARALPPDYALQHPLDWIDSVRLACQQAMRPGKIEASRVVGVGVAFTSCTMLPTRADGTPLCLTAAFADAPLAWPKLWKHHGAKEEADLITGVARARDEPWLSRYGGAVGIEWFFPKILETLRAAPEVYASADLWIEAGDWLVWQLVSGPFPTCRVDALVRSTCQAGYKALWNAQTGYPSSDFFHAVDARFADVARKLPGRLAPPGTRAGGLSDRGATLLGLTPGTPVSAAIIDAHAGVPGAGVAEAGTLVLVMGTSSCHMLMSSEEAKARGIAGVVKDGILPGFYGYETGQASVGDAFAWLVKTLGVSHADMNRLAADLPPGSGGVIALDWLNGCRTPLMDARLGGAFIGLTLATRPEQMYRALLEATAFGVRWIVDTLRDANIPVTLYVAAGGLPARSPLLMHIYADVLDAEIRLAESEQSVALGTAVLGALAAGEATTGFSSAGDAIHAMARQRETPVYRPNPTRQKQYEKLYAIYRSLAQPEGPLASAMRSLRTL